MRLVSIIRSLFCGAIVASSLLLASACLAQPPPQRAFNVRLVTDEAEAVLSILAKKRANLPIVEADWQRLFSSEGYVRLKKRETAMQRSFEDADFKTFVLSEALLARASTLQATLDKWRRAEINVAARRALAYLPKGAHLRAKIYPVIKPRDNSFVFDLRTDPAIFLYLDPAQSKEQFENHLAHELHHIGYAASCPSKQVSEQTSSLSKNAKTVLVWVGAFGEGFAMLAAAGGPQVHPHAVSPPEDHARWDKDVSNFNADLKRVEKFLLDVLENRLTDEGEINKIAFSFFGVQGPWYTVGWKMAVVIEKVYGRARLIESFCDGRKLLQTYNSAVVKYNRKEREPLALWSNALISGFGNRPS
jgi:hypothetical protein